MARHQRQLHPGSFNNAVKRNDSPLNSTMITGSKTMQMVADDQCRCGASGWGVWGLASSVEQPPLTLAYRKPAGR
ncbi:hypothetical protein NQZ68_019151 [Dissostichus eleginoides]|nr:hypothetical protein NQZ68_019151 [Dissostichus eleginoides]